MMTSNMGEKLMNSKMLLLAFAVLFAMISQASVASAEVNMNDPKLIQEANIQANPQVMRAQALVRGVACETGACYQDADPKLGYDSPVTIEPSGAVSAPSKSKEDGVTK